VPMPSIAVRASQSSRMRAYLRRPGDIRQGHGQQVAGDDVAGRIAARIGEGDPGKVRLPEVCGDSSVKARSDQTGAQTVYSGMDGIFGRYGAHKTVCGALVGAGVALRTGRFRG
jgi:hypothetical protein